MFYVIFADDEKLQIYWSRTTVDLALLLKGPAFLIMLPTLLSHVTEAEFLWKLRNQTQGLSGPG